MRATARKDAFADLMQRYQAYIYTVCYSFVQDAATAEDLAQETFLAAYLHRASCPPGNEKPWLARIAINKAKDHLRSGWQRRVQLNPDETADPMADLPAPEAQQPEVYTLAAERTAAVRQAVCSLPQPYHDVAVLVFLQDLTPDDAARLTGRPIKTVYTQLSRAKKLLAEKLRQEVTVP